MTIVAGLLLALTSLALFGFGVNLLYLSFRALRLPAPAPPAPGQGPTPHVCVQLPIYNERYVAERVLDAVCAFDWPARSLEVQVLDDSDDETSQIVAGATARWRRRGVRVVHVRRAGREGYKAGALAYGMTLTKAGFFAVFDADFVPPPGLLRQLMPAFADARVGFAQARWGHLNEGYSLFTRVQALAIDFHFLVEQSVRSAGGFFTNFTGTAGIWRRQAIADAGGWSAATLTEDLDLSYRAQLRGWKPAYLEGLVVPEELPVDVNAYRRQQARWATGSFQAAFRLLPAVIGGRRPAGVKLQAAVHLLSYGVGPLMLVQLACYPFLLYARAHQDPIFALGSIGLVVNSVSLAPWIGFMVAQVRRARPWWRGLPAVLCQVVGAGMAITVLVALFRALRPGGEFVRTAKYRIEAAGQEWRDGAYVQVGDPAALAELVVGLGALAITWWALQLQVWLIAVYSALFAAGLFTLAGMTVAQAVQVVTLRRLGRDALARLRGIGPAAVLLLLPVVLLGGMALIGDPFEDSYHHWLIAATLAETGRLHDPLFGMEDTWLPGYHLLAAAVLKLFGLWQLGLLKAVNVGLAVTTLAIVHQLAGSPRRGRLAVIFLALNPIFLLTATSTVAEPLMGVGLVGASAAALSGRLRAAAVLLAVAALTGTKAWLWIGGLLAVQLAGLLLRRPWPRLRPALSWALPALALLAVLQLGFAPASHSVARAAVEVGSATARGSLPLGPGARLGDFAGWFALASIPVLVLAPLGLLAELRTLEGRARLRLLHAPAAIYLTVVIGLVGAGAYTGSHRYYYLALPSLALLAAAALDRYRAPVVLAAVAATTMVTIGMLPVLESFAADNTGLIRAGRSAGSIQGALLTDSPVAAFASHKQPSAIIGSQALPADYASAVMWLRDHRVTSVVVESVDYYRASAVFPGLGAGTASAPFVPLGDEGAFQVQGGKTVHVYWVAPPGRWSEVGNEVYVGLLPGRGPAVGDLGMGKTGALQKGLLLDVAGRPATAEGMGFGDPIAHYADGWYFSGSGVTSDLSTPGRTVISKVFELDRREVDDPEGHFLRFEPAPSRGRIQVDYRISGQRIAVSVRPPLLAPGLLGVAVLNEQSGAFDDYADPGRTLAGPAFGSWVAARGDWARLRSQSLGLEWSQPALPDAELYGAHEVRPPAIDFSGLEYEFGPGFAGADYTITVRRAR